MYIKVRVECATAKYELGLMFRVGKKLGNAGVYVGASY